MWRRLSTAGKGAFSPELNSYELVSTEEEDSLNENHRLLTTNGYRRPTTASGNNFNYADRATDNSLISAPDSNQNHYTKLSTSNRRVGDSFGEQLQGGSGGLADGDSWNQPAYPSDTSRKMIRRSSERDTNRISSVDNPNYCSVNMAMSVDDVVDASRTPPENRRASSPYNVMSPADDSRRGESNGCLSALSKLLRCMFCCCFWFAKFCFGGAELCDREITIGQPMTGKFPPNVIKNQKYNIITFIPLVLFQQFKFFLNMYFLVMACSQFFPDIQIGYWYTYWGPLIFVLTITLIREAIDDVRRRRRDREINYQKYTKMSKGELTYIPSSNIKVGDMILVEKDQRVPADMVLLRTSDRSGRCFVRTDQLDGETDWKLRLPILQEYENDVDLFNHNHRFIVYAEKPQMDIHSFIGTLTKRTVNEDEQQQVEEIGISVENTMWANTVLAAGNAVGLVIYTGRETRSVMNNSTPRSKTGLIDLEINNLTKILFVAVVALAFLMICLKGFEGPWPRYMFRFVLLFSYIIPISLRVNMDMAKSFYAYTIQNDKSIAGTVARSTTIPEDLGRISYLLTDKTGTLTQNEMIFKRLMLATSQADSPEDVIDRLKQGLRLDHSKDNGPPPRVTEIARVTEAIKALAVCHNVTPVYEGGDDEMDFGASDREATYQASSPDEIALVKYTKDVGLSLVRRDQSSMILKSFTAGISLEYQILQVFPFTSEAKRMGIIVKEKQSGEITFYVKGADGVMKNIVRYNDWLDEACGNMARDGLRTLVVAKKVMNQNEYDEFERKYNAAKSSKADRAQQVYKTMCAIENNMDLLCVTGVEDTLQKDVKVTLETLRNAGIKIWMLTGDKLETATCIAKSSKLVSTQQEIYTFKEISDRTQAFTELNNFRKKSDTAMVIRGESLEVCLKYFEREFMELACGSPVVIVCRCSPTQKARMVELVQKTTGKRTAAIGDGGNDVAMIQSADVGIGIEGKEGRQASLAADFSILQFSFVATLLLVHGRYSYKRSASLAQFVMHRGLIITVMQAVFSSIFYFSSVALYQGFLMIGYATVYTMLPVFALTLDKDVKEEDLLRLPELYAELGRGRSLTLKTFFLWVMISVYQGGILMYGALILFRDEFIHIVSISFTALIFTELIMVALTIRNMHKLMIVAEVISFLVYVVSLIVFRNYFDSDFILSFNFMWKVSVITLMSCVPIFVFKYIRQVCAPPNYAKLN